MRRFEVATVLALLVGGAASPHAQRQAGVGAEVRSTDGLAPSNSAITDPSLIAVTSDYRFVGREVAFQDVYVQRVGPFGFWISTPYVRDETFVIPAEGRLIAAKAGDRVSIHGEIRQMSADLRRRLFLGYAWNEHIYVHAFTVRPTGLW